MSDSKIVVDTKQDSDVNVKLDTSLDSIEHESNLTNFDKIDSSRVKSKIRRTVLWIIYFAVGILITVFSVSLHKGIEYTFSINSILNMVLIFLCINAEKYIGVVSVVCIFFAIKRKEYPKYFAFMLGFYTVLLILSIIGVIIV